MEKVEFSENIQACMFSINQKLRPIMEKNLQPFSITNPQFHMLMALRREGASRVTQLAEVMKVKPSAITVIMDRLIERGLVQRYHSKVDRRVVIVELSSRGNEELEKMIKSHRQLMSQYFEQFTKEELMTFLQLFQKLDQAITTKIDDEVEE